MDHGDGRVYEAEKPKEKIVVPDKWYIQVGDHTFVGVNEDVPRHEAIAFPSARSARIFLLDAYGKDSNLVLFHVKGRTYEIGRA